MKVSEGSTIQVKGKGKVVVVSLKSRSAFEIGDDSTARVETDTVRPLKGTVNPKTGYAPPAGKDGKIGGIVMRGADNQKGCLKLISPVKTKIVELTPELRWENNCSGVANLGVTILSDEQVVHSAEVRSVSSYRVPENVLKAGNRYLWMIDGGSGFDTSSGVFMVAENKEREEVTQQTKSASSTAAPEDRLAYMYFLSDRGFSELAKVELGKLRTAFPEAAGLLELP